MSYYGPKNPDRAAARQDIVAAANAVREPNVRRLFMRNLQEAVCIVRRRKLVKPKVLTAAGFNAA